MNKKRGYSIGLIMAAIGVIMLGTDRLIASANSTASFTSSLTVATFIALGILLITAVWLFWLSFR